MPKIVSSTNTSNPRQSLDGILPAKPEKKKKQQGHENPPKVRLKVKTIPADPRELEAPTVIHPKGQKKPKNGKITVTTLLLCLAFVSGMIVMNATQKSQAQDSEDLTSQKPNSSVVEIFEGELPENIQTAPSTQNLLTMSLEQIESFLATTYTTNNDPEEVKLQKRIDFLKVYLKKKKSPLVEFADVIAKLQHWKLVLAISNSESSLGKKCADNNCSGIGVEPGHRLWREYENKGEWAKDLDRLIEKRYKNWTLEEMNGVYNYPGSSNWVFAANQILSDLKGVE